MEANPKRPLLVYLWWIVYNDNPYKLFLFKTHVVATQ